MPILKDISNNGLTAGLQKIEQISWTANDPDRAYVKVGAYLNQLHSETEGSSPLWIFDSAYQVTCEGSPPSLLAAEQALIESHSDFMGGEIA